MNTTRLTLGSGHVACMLRPLATRSHPVLRSTVTLLTTVHSRKRGQRKRSSSLTEETEPLDIVLNKILEAEKTEASPVRQGSTSDEFQDVFKLPLHFADAPSDRSPLRSETTQKLRMHSPGGYEGAITQHSDEGKLPEAVALLQEARSKDVYIRRRFYYRVLDRIERAGDERSAALVRSIWSDMQARAAEVYPLLPPQSEPAPDELEPELFTWFSSPSRDEKYVDTDDVGKDEVWSDDVAEAVCFRPPQRNSWTAFDQLLHQESDLPNLQPWKFNRFINLYDLKDDVDGLAELRRYVIYHRSRHTDGEQVLSSWLTTEMRTLVWGRRYSELLALYSRYFDMSGIPSIAVERMEQVRILVR